MCNIVIFKRELWLFYERRRRAFRGFIIKVEEALELNIVKCNILLHFYLYKYFICEIKTSTVKIKEGIIINNYFIYEIKGVIYGVKVNDTYFGNCSFLLD